MKTKEFLLKNKKILSISNANLNDAEDIIFFKKIVVSETHFLAKSPLDEIPTKQKQEDSIKNYSLNGALLIARIENEIVALAGFESISKKVKKKHRCELFVYVKKSFWNQGIGKTILNQIIKLAKEQGYEQIELIVSESNQRAINLYESLGFKTTGRFPNAMKLADDHYDDTLFMIQFLN